MYDTLQSEANNELIHFKRKMTFKDNIRLMAHALRRKKQRKITFFVQDSEYKTELTEHNFGYHCLNFFKSKPLTT